MTATTNRTLTLTALAMLAFAANSVLCRAALGPALIDAASFTVLRILSGAAVLLVIWMTTRSAREPLSVDWPAALMLFAYALAFSFAYISLEAGAGALILFGCVQLTMIGAGLWRGQRPTVVAWLGMSVALGGLVRLVLPNFKTPSVSGAALMAVAGVAWGLYSLRGQGNDNPVRTTTGNFIGAVPMAVAVAALLLPTLRASGAGVILAMLSGALTSGVGYVIWYAALPGLTSGQAANVQLCVPAIAAMAGVIWLSEPLTVHLVVASAAILGGIALVLGQRQQH